MRVVAHLLIAAFVTFNVDANSTDNAIEQGFEPVPVPVSELVSNDHPSKQKQFDELLIGFSTQNPEDVPSLEKLKTLKKVVNGNSTSFFKDVALVESVEEAISSDGYKADIFDILDFDVRKKTKKLYNLFSSFDDWRDLYSVANALKQDIPQEQLTYALATSVFHHFNNFRFAPPNWFEVFPNYLLPASTLRELYRRKMKGIKETVVYVNIANETFHAGKNNKYFNAFSDTDPEARLRYFRDDAGLSNMFINWHLHFPHWRRVGSEPNTESWEDRGHLFYYFHQQLLFRYNLERFTHGLEPVDGLSWDKMEMGRYVLDLLDNDGDPMPGRHAGAPNIQNTWWKRVNDLSGLQHRISQVVDSNLILNKYHHQLEPLYPDLEIYQLGNTILGTGNSSHPEYYGSYFFEGIDAVNIMGKGDIADNKQPGFFFKMLTTLRDPIFYSMLENIRTFIQDYTSAYLQNYDHLGVSKNTNSHCLHLSNLHVMYCFCGSNYSLFEVSGNLTTFFDYEEIDVSKVVDLGPNEKHKDIKYRARILRLNHEPFNYTFRWGFSESYFDDRDISERNMLMARTFLGPVHDWKGRKMDFQTAKHYFIEIDRFAFDVKPGTVEFVRSSKDSSIYIDGGLNYAKVDDMMRSGKKAGKDWDLNYTKDISFCGLPNNLMLPKGSPQGTKYQLVSVMIPFVPSPQMEHVIREFKSFPLCGNLPWMDYWTGFPFDRVDSLPNDFVKYSGRSTEITIYHRD